MVTPTPASAPPKGWLQPLAPVRRSGRDPIDLQAPATSIRRYRAVCAVGGAISRLYSRVRVEGIERVPAGAAILCFNHQNWADPLYMFAAFPRGQRMYFFGPKEEEMRRGLRNRLMRWCGVVVPYRPGNRGLVAATARVEALLGRGALIAIAGEGQIHSGEGVVLPIQRGPAYLSLRAGVPVVPVALNGTSWLGFQRPVRVRIGAPISPVNATPARPGADEVAILTTEIQDALEALVADFPDREMPGRVGRLLTELFNDWPDGSRPPAGACKADARAPDPIADR